MHKRIGLFGLVIFAASALFFVLPKGDTIDPPKVDAEKLYQRLELERGSERPPRDLFRKGYGAFRELAEEGELEKELMVLIDMRLSSNKERLWVLDLDSGSVSFQTLVAHGKGSGNEYARNFSNTPGSHKTSLGLYVTAGTYQGKHGLSLRLDGMEQGFNNNARDRAIVMHGADYVSEAFAERYGRIGRSYGCPSVPLGVHKELLPKIREGACLFIYYPKEDYLEGSEYLKEKE